MSSLTDYEDTLLASSPALALALANAYEMGRRGQPDYQPAADDLEAQLDSGVKEDVIYEFDRKSDPSRVDAYLNPSSYGSNEKLADGGYRVYYNPEAHPAYLAHEMGHGAAQQTKLGEIAHNLRTGGSDPQFQRLARMGPGFDIGMAGAVAALTPGDDDLAESILGSYVGNASIIADEALASAKALEILKQAHGGVIPRGSRMRLAGGLGGYLATPALTGSVANYVGNLMDSEVRPPSNTANVA